MLDIGWWELIVIGVIALIVVGPRELPALLRTIGRYVGMAKRQADEFRSQFDEAIRDSEFNDLRNELTDIKSGVTSSLDAAQQSINKELRETADDYDWDADGKIEPAPEFAGDEPTTSFTMADGTVVSKQDDGDPLADQSTAPSRPDTPPQSVDVASDGVLPESDASPARAPSSLAQASGSDSAGGDQPGSIPPRDAEAVR